VNEQTHDFLQRTGLNAGQLLALERLPQDSSDLCIFLSGSLVEGLGNNTSDIDLYVIGEARPSGPLVIRKKNAFCISKHVYGERRVDVEFWSLAGATELADKLDHIVVDRDLDAFECEAVDFMHRLKVGLPLSAQKTFEHWKTRFNFPKLLQYQKARARLNLEDMLEDVAGMLARPDLESAFIRSRDLLDEMVIYSLRSLGESNPKMKWRMRLLQKYQDADLARWVSEQFWTLQYPDAHALRSDPHTLLAHVDACRRVAAKVLQDACLHHTVPA
jgi:predicted nucleotidyltransferase